MNTPAARFFLALCSIDFEILESACTNKELGPISLLLFVKSANNRCLCSLYKMVIFDDDVEFKIDNH